MPVKLKRRGYWAGFDATTVGALGDAAKKALIDVEQNTSDAIDGISRATRPAWNAVSVHANYQAQLWDMVIAQANCLILLPEPSPQNRGAEIRVIRDGTFSVVLQPIVGLINGAASFGSLSANEGATFVSSGLGWHLA